MSGLTQALRPDGTSEGDIQALRPGRIRAIRLGDDIDPENPDEPIVYVPTAGTGVFQIKITDTDHDARFYAVPAGEAFLQTTEDDEEIENFDLVSPGERLTYAVAEGVKFGFKSDWSEGVVRIIEGV